MRTQIINDLMTNIFFNLIETEDRIAADERFEGLSSNDALEIYKVLSDQLIRTHIYAAHIGSGISSRIAMLSYTAAIPWLGSWRTKKS